MKRVSIYYKLLIVLAVFILLSYFIKGNNELTFSETIFFSFLVVSTFIFGIILAFSIANRHSRLSNIRESLRAQDSILINIYLSSRIFNDKVLAKIREKIDEFLISQIDYKLIDFDKESPQKLKELYFFLEDLEEKSEKQKQVKSNLLDDMRDLVKLQKEISYYIKSKMMFYEWFSLTILGLIILFCLLYTNENSVISVIITSLLGTALSLLLFVLKDLDSLGWQEQNWIWEPLSRLFTELDLLPYYPEDLFKQGRLRIKDIEQVVGVKEVRIAHYPHKYPDFRDKKIEIVNLEK